MKLIDLKCENCGANLKIDTDNIQAFCQYCGSKLLIDMDRLSEVLKEKEKTKQVIEKEQHITKRKEMDQNYKKGKEKREFKETIIVFILVIGICLLMSII